ncbi:MAG: TIGR03905 family TSCPD domain-containing protein [Ruminococcaceae bacterium]|nr:TIGR03905 family TSCPD domain-containing protein [Oscillospiraceae bacterium]
MERFTYQTKGVCSRAIEIEIEDGIVVCVKYQGGCSGNTQGVAALVRGMSVTDAIERLSGIRCGMKSTSCPDQLATALREYLANK